MNNEQRNKLRLPVYKIENFKTEIKIFKRTKCKFQNGNKKNLQSAELT